MILGTIKNFSRKRIENQCFNRYNFMILLTFAII